MRVRAFVRRSGEARDNVDIKNFPLAEENASEEVLFADRGLDRHTQVQVVADIIFRPAERNERAGGGTRGIPRYRRILLQLCAGREIRVDYNVGVAGFEGEKLCADIVDDADLNILIAGAPAQ